MTSRAQRTKRGVEIYLEPHVLEALDLRAKEYRCSRSALVSMAIKSFLNEGA